MFESQAKLKTTEFLRHIEVLAQNVSHKIVCGFQGAEQEREFILKIVSDTWDLVNHNECGVGLGNLLSNLHEVNFKLDRKAITLARTAIEECKLDYENWRFIEELQR